MKIEKQNDVIDITLDRPSVLRFAIDADRFRLFLVLSNGERNPCAFNYDRTEKVQVKPMVMTRARLQPNELIEDVPGQLPRVWDRVSVSPKPIPQPNGQYTGTLYWNAKTLFFEQAGSGAKWYLRGI